MFHKTVTNALMKELQVGRIVWLWLNQMVWIFLWSEGVAFLFRSIPDVFILTAIERWRTEPHSEQGQNLLMLQIAFFMDVANICIEQNSLWWPSDGSTSSLKGKTSVLKIAIILLEILNWLQCTTSLTLKNYTNQITTNQKTCGTSARWMRNYWYIMKIVID